MPGESKTSKRRLTAYKRQLAALELRESGHTYSEIAAELGYAGPPGAYKAIMTVLRETQQEPSDRVRAIELRRVDRLMKVYWPAALTGNIDHANMVRQLMRDRARLLGLDAPIKVQHLDPEDRAEAKRLAVRLGLPIEEVVKEAERILREAHA